MRVASSRSKGWAWLARLWLYVVVCACVAAVAGWIFLPSADGATSEPDSMILAGDPLTVVGSPMEPEEVAAERQARSANPEILAEKLESGSKFEGLSSDQAASVDGEAFPALVDEPAGGFPVLPEGARVLSYSSSSSASVELSDGRHAGLSSLLPIATEVHEGQNAPIDLRLVETGHGFQVKTPNSDAQVLIPKRLSEGPVLTSSDVGLVPVDEHGTALGGEGVVDGATVFYGDSESPSSGSLDMDTIVKPNTYGFSTETVLRSERSPQKLYYKVRMPEGASLVQVSTGAVEVMDAGQAIAVIPAPSAYDAEGSQVVVSMSVSVGNTITVSVQHKSGQYRDPIVVDPTIIDNKIYLSHENNNWAFSTDNSSAFSQVSYYDWAEIDVESPGAGQYGYVVYPTQGESHIYRFTATTKQEDLPYLKSLMSIASPGSSVEAEEAQPASGESTHTICTVSCEPGTVTSTNKENRAYLEDRAIETGQGISHTDLTAASVYLLQEKGPSVKLDTNDPTIKGVTNPLYAGTWASNKSIVGLDAFDPGLGLYGGKLKSPSKPGWELRNYEGFPSDCVGVQCNECDEDTCPTGAKGVPASIPLLDSGLPEGEDIIEGEVDDSINLKATSARMTLKLDNAPPHSIELLGLPSGNVIGDATYHFTVKATDGEGTTPSSGVKSIVVYINGHRLSEVPEAFCSSGPCTASGEWTVNGEELGAGSNTMTVVATDNAGNVAEKNFTLQVRHASPIAMGPGMVDPQSGQLVLSGGGVSMGDGLVVSDSYRSRATSGETGAFGSQWTSSLAGQQSITEQPNGSMVLVGATGAETIFDKKETGFESPRGDPNLSLSEITNEGVKELVLKNAAVSTSTGFRVPAGGTGTLWLPSVQKGVLPSETVTFSSETTSVEGKSVTRPSMVLGAVATGITCPVGKELKELKPGCRALKFVYAKGTKATGENESEWGEYDGRLKEVVFVAFEKAVMKEKPVKSFFYDKQGRLRAEWDPRISPTLKTVYGYDSEGHITAVTAPGQETWAFVYGTTVQDLGAGRVLKTAQAPVTAPLWAGALPVNTEAPKLSGTPVVKNRMAVSYGVWTGSPVVYGYQWYDCNATGGECVPIGGATNANYTPTNGDIGHTLRATVTATNGGGSVNATAVTSEEVGQPVYSLQTGSAGSGAGQFKSPQGIAVDPKGNVWVVDSGNDRVEEFNEKGEYIRTVGSKGTGNGQFEDPTGIAADSKGNVWVTDTGNYRVEEFNEKGEYVKQLGYKGTIAGAFEWPFGITVDPKGNVWVTDLVKDSLEEFNKKGEWEVEITQIADPCGIAADSEGNVWLTGCGNDSIEEYNAQDQYVRQFGSKGSGPGQLEDPIGIAIGPSGTVWVADYEDGRIQEFTSTGEYMLTVGSKGKGNGQTEDADGIAVDAKGDLWAGDIGDDRIEKWVPPTVVEGQAVAPQPGSTIEYNVPISGSGAPHAMGAKEVEEGWAQKDDPTEASAIFPPDEPQSWPATSYKRATIYYRDSTGRTVNVAMPTEGISTSEYNSSNDVVRTLSADNRTLALKEAKPAEAAKLLDTQNTYNTEGTELLSTLGPRHLVKLGNGKEVQARSHTDYEYDLNAPSEDGPYRLVTKMTQGAQTESEGEQDVRTVATSYSGQGNLGWKLRKPTSVTSDPSGLKITHTTLYEEMTGSVMETRMPKSTGAESPHDTKTVYYTAGPDAGSPQCGEHPEWATLVCETLPGKQPNVAGAPNLPVDTTTAYNIYGEPLTGTSKASVCVKVAAGKGKYTNDNCTSSGTGEYEMQESTRTTTETYDEAGRLTTSETSGVVGKALPKVTYKYNEATGALDEQSTSSESLKSTYNKVGELTGYTDAVGDTTTYEYEGEGSYEGEKEKDGRLRHASNAEGTETLSYNGTTGLLDEAAISGIGTFAATYDVEGNLASETYPNGMVAAYTENPAGERVGLVYKKETHCTENCEWFKDTAVPTIHGQWSVQTSSLGKDTYAYDTIGRLVEATQTPVGKGCVTRRYAYDEDTNRTSLTTYPPNGKNECATESSVVEKHTYDEADQLTDAGVAYEPFGETAKLPAGDAGGSELSSGFYVDGQLATQEQNGQAIGYNLDPSGRASEIVSTGKIDATETLHYTGPDDTVAWTSELSGSTTRDINVLGGLVATQYDAEVPVLQLTNLHGDIVATAQDSETTSKLASTIAEPTEFGVPATEAPPKYSWLGSHEIRTELPSGVQAMGARSYVPQLGRFLQSDPVSGGSGNAYAYTDGDPLNTYDLTGDYTATIDEFDEKYVGGRASEAAAVRAAEIRAAEEAAARAEAERQAAEAAQQAAAYAAMYGSEAEGEEWEEEWWEEESEDEEAAYHPGTKGQAEAHTEEGMLYQPLGTEGTGEGASLLGSVVPLCVADSDGPCAHFEVMTHHFSPRQFRITCRVVAALAIGCGGDDFMERQHEYEMAHPPAVTVEARPGGGSGEEDAEDLMLESSFDDGD